MALAFETILNLVTVTLAIVSLPKLGAVTIKEFLFASITVAGISPNLTILFAKTGLKFSPSIITLAPKKQLLVIDVIKGTVESLKVKAIVLERLPSTETNTSTVVSLKPVGTLTVISVSDLLIISASLKSKVTFTSLLLSPKFSPRMDTSVSPVPASGDNDVMEGIRTRS